MSERYREDAFDSLIKHAGYDILAEMADEIPDHQEILSRIGNTDALDKAMKKTIQEDINKRRLRRVGKIFLRVASVILIILVVSAVAMASSQALRASIMNLFYFSEDDTSKISIVEEDDTDEFSNMLVPSYLPKGFYLIQKSSLNKMIISVYENTNADTITIEQIEGELQMIGSEEKEDSHSLEINDKPAFLMENEEFNVLIAYSDYASVTVTADSAVTIEELINITKSLFK